MSNPYFVLTSSLPRSVVDSLKSDTKAQNVQRENKAYSYKEQMEEEALRKEIEAKKAKKEGKTKVPELSVKQKEAMKVQLEKEQEIRAKVSSLETLAAPILLLLTAVAEERPAVLAPHLTSLLPVLHKAVLSPVVAERVAGLLTELRRAVFQEEEETLGQVVAGVTLQVK